MYVSPVSRVQFKHTSHLDKSPCLDRFRGRAKKTGAFGAGQWTDAVHGEDCSGLLAQHGARLSDRRGDLSHGVFCQKGRSLLN